MPSAAILGDLDQSPEQDLLHPGFADFTADVPEGEERYQL
jgi:hypothetical protein